MSIEYRLTEKVLPSAISDGRLRECGIFVNPYGVLGACLVLFTEEKKMAGGHCLLARIEDEGYVQFLRGSRSTEAPILAVLQKAFNIKVEVSDPGEPDNDLACESYDEMELRRARQNAWLSKSKKYRDFYDWLSQASCEDRMKAEQDWFDNLDPQYVKETKEWRAVRKAEGLKIDPKAAETFWTYGSTIDPYGAWNFPDWFEDNVGREYWARNPGSEIWVNFCDLPAATSDALWKRDGRNLAFPAGLPAL